MPQHPRLGCKENPKKSDKPQKGCWAPGNYHCHCSQCGDHFIGDKRAVTCADCAYKNNKEQA